MFDNIKCEYPLPYIPQGIIDAWGDDITFQTKDTPNQCLNLYKIGSDGKLYEQKVEGYWKDLELLNENTAADDTKEKPFGWFSPLSKYHETSREWVEIAFNGSINFYESYSHPDKPAHALLSDDSRRYVYGWIEYQAQFVDGKIQGNIILIKDELPIRYTDEEFAAKKEKWNAQRAESIQRFKENRKNKEQRNQ